MTRAVYYNDNYAPSMEILRAAVRAGLLPDGEFDDRSILDVDASELRGFRQWHFFSGIGGWPMALRRAGWEGETRIMTGSCPCQPFAAPGKHKGFEDDRDLWPEMLRLISELRPLAVFGEQVATPAGRNWLARLQTDLEAIDYPNTACDLAAASVGAPHIRQRHYWLAYDQRGGRKAGLRPHPYPDGGCGAWSKSASGGWVGNAGRTRLEGYTGDVNPCSEPRWIIAGAPGSTPETSDAVLHTCVDGRTRPVPLEQALSPMADGVPGSARFLHGSGNAVVMPLARAFIEEGMAAIANVLKG